MLGTSTNSYSTYTISISILLTPMVIYFDLQPVENHLLDNLDNSCSIRVKFSSQGDMDMSVKVSNTV